MKMGNIRVWAVGCAAALILFLAGWALVLDRRLESAKAEVQRLEHNQETLLGDVTFERNRAGELQATVDALTLRRDELERLLPEYVRRLADMGVRLREAESVARVSMEQAASVKAVRDTVYVPIQSPADGTDVRRRYRYSDEWIDADVEVDLRVDTAGVTVRSRDSLTIVAHRARKRCLFPRFRVGKVTHYTVASSSPYSEITGFAIVEVID